MMNEKNIALIGFMGAGKTVVSDLLAQRLGRRRRAIDDLIIEADGRQIGDIFSQSGEPYFRELESRVIAEVVQDKGLVIDCGGGVVLKEENVRRLKNGGLIVYLKADPDVIYERVKDQTHRPLLNVGDPKKKITELMSVREGIYEKAADRCVVTDGKTPEEIVEEIAGFLGMA